MFELGRTARIEKKNPLHLWITGLQITFRNQLGNDVPIGEVLNIMIVS